MPSKPRDETVHSIPDRAVASQNLEYLLPTKSVKTSAPIHQLCCCLHDCVPSFFLQLTHLHLLLLLLLLFIIINFIIIIITQV